MNKEKAIRMLNDVQNDMQRDVEDINGDPISGAAVALYFGHQAAAISAVAQVLKSIVEDNE